MSKKENFTMHPDLLKDVIFKQSGSVLKSIEEAIQNSLDANSKNIHIFLTDKGMKIIDDGCGMEEKDILHHFKVFGNSSKKNDDTKAGKFGMGRGQIFAQGIVKWQTKKNVMITDCLNSLSYKFRKAKKSFKGTKIMVLFYKKLDEYELSRTLEKLKYYFLPVDMNMYINGEKFEIEREVMYSDDNFEVFLTGLYSKRIYSQGLYVKSYDTLTVININCKNKMELNFARNSFLEDKETTKKLYELINTFETVFLKKMKKYDPTSGKKVISFILEGKLDTKDFDDKKIIEICDGKMVSLKEIENKTILFADKTRQADKALKQGNIVINKEYAYVLQNMKNKGLINYYKDSRDINEIVKKDYHREKETGDLYNTSGKKALVNFYLIKYMNYKLFNDERNLILGVSDTSNGWTDGLTYIYVNQKYCNYYQKNKLLADVFTLLCHEYSHEDNDIEDMMHDKNFYEKYYYFTKNLMNKFIIFMNNITLNEVMKHYEKEIEEDIESSKKLKRIHKKEKLGKTSIKILNTLKTLNDNRKQAVSTKDIQKQCNIDDTYVSEVLCKLEKQYVVEKKTRKNLSYVPEDKKTRSFWKITEYGVDILNKNI